MKKYGLPYMGSKDKLADRILRHIPSADCFVDLFAGGCSMTHAALLSGRYKRVIANDVSDIPQVFVNAARGMYDNEDRWISREDFCQLRDKDPFVRLVWSFSNNLNDYIYGRDVEQFKKALHWAVYYRDAEPLKEYGIDVSGAVAIEDRYRRWLSVKRACGRAGDARLQSDEQNRALVRLGEGRTYIQNFSAAENLKEWECLSQNFDSCQRTNSISRLSGGRGLSGRRPQAGERHPRLDISSLTVLQGDYRDVEIPCGSVVYCDPPYLGTRQYDKRGASPFDHEAYYEWLRTRPFPVWCSEYRMPPDFACIAQFRHRATNSATKGHENNAVVEKLFLHEKWIGQRVQRGLFD